MQPPGQRARLGVHGHALGLRAVGDQRLHAAEHVILLRLQQAGLADRVAVKGEDRGGRLVMRFLAADGAELQAHRALEPSIGALMAGFALAWEMA